MRFGQPKEEKRAWPKAFLALLQEAHGDYRINKLVKGTRTECLRRTAEGLYHSQNTFCLHGRYRHCFCVMLSPALAGPDLLSPFVAGGRLNHNHTIQDAFDRDLQLPRAKWPSGLHSVHEWRSGTEEIVRRCTSNAETYLAPFYRRLIVGASAVLLELLERLEVRSADLEDPSFPTAFTRQRDVCLNFTLPDLTHPKAGWWALGAPLRYDALMAVSPELFRAQRPYVQEMRQTVERLAEASRHEEKK